MKKHYFLTAASVCLGYGFLNLLSPFLFQNGINSVRVFTPDTTHSQRYFLLNDEDSVIKEVVNGSEEIQTGLRPEFKAFQTLVSEKFEQIQATEFTFENMHSHKVTTPNGLVLKIPVQAFVDETGKLVEGKVDFTIKEVLSKKDMLLANLQTTSGDQLLASGGMYEFRATANGKEVYLAQGKVIDAAFPAKQVDSEMKFFYGEKKVNGQIDWAITEEFRSSSFQNGNYESAAIFTVPKKETDAIVTAQRNWFKFQDRPKNLKYKLVWEDSKDMLELKEKYEKLESEAQKLKTEIVQAQKNYIEKILSEELNKNVQKELGLLLNLSFNYVRRYHGPKQLQTKYGVSAGEEKKIIKIIESINTSFGAVKTDTLKEVVVGEKKLLNIHAQKDSIVTKIIDFQLINLEILAETYPDLIFPHVKTEINGDYGKHGKKSFLGFPAEIYSQESQLKYSMYIDKYKFTINVKTPNFYHNYVQVLDLRQVEYQYLGHFWELLNKASRNQLKFQLPTGNNQFAQKAKLIPQDEHTEQRYQVFQQELKTYQKIKMHNYYYGHNYEVAHYCLDDCKIGNYQKQSYTRNAAITKLGFYNCDKFVKEPLYTFKGKVKADSLLSRMVIYLVAEKEKIVLTQQPDTNGNFEFRFPTGRSFQLIAMIENKAIGNLAVKSADEKLPELIVKTLPKDKIYAKLDELLTSN